MSAAKRPRKATPRAAVRKPHRVIITNASAIEAKKIEFVDRAKRIPRGMITVVSGRAGGGKSTFCVELAADVSQRHHVILSNHEDPHAEVLRPRLEVAGAKLSRVLIPEMPYLLPRDVDELEQRIKETRAVLVIFDAAAQHLEKSMHAGQQVRQALTPLSKMLERTHCACVFVDHLRKKVSARSHPLEALSGAGSGLPAAARFVYVFGHNPNDPNERILAPVKVNAVLMDTSVAYEMDSGAIFVKGGKTVEVGRLIRVNDASDVDASQVLSFNGGGKAADASPIKAAIAQEWLTGALMFGERLASELESEGKDAGFSWSTVRRAGEGIEIIRRREGFGKGSKVWWKLPDDHPAVQMGTLIQAQGS